MTLNEYLCYSEGIAKEKEFQLHNTRLIMWSIMQPHLRKGKTLKPTDLMQLSMDKKVRVLKPNIGKEKALKKYKQIKDRWQRIKS